MRVISIEIGSLRERVDADADLLPIANWHIAWIPGELGVVRAQERHIVLSSRLGTKRSSVLWLTEQEAIAIARAVTDDILTRAATDTSQMHGEK